jgi:hypothetical protein
MATPWRAIAFVAGVAAASGIAAAQPIVSPRQVTDPGPTKAAKPAEAKPAAAKPPAAKSAKTTKASSTKAKSARATKAKAKSAKATKATTKNAKPKTAKTAKSAKPARPPKSSARLAATSKRGARGDNMPRGFAWPPTPEMQAAGKACEADLDALGVTWKRSAPEGRIAAPIEVPDGMLGGIKYTSKWRSPPHTLDCQLARALALIGRDLHAIGVREVRWSSIYRWTNVRTNGQELPILSRHALGLAMDIYDFIDDAGRVVNVLQHYPGGDALLIAVEQAVNASGKFRMVLTPRNDPRSHHDHFHFEANPDYTAP